MSFNAARIDGAGYSIVEDAPLAGRNTLRVDARAALLVDVRDAAALPEVLGFPLVRASPLLVLGEGSNLLLTRDYAGVVLTPAMRGIAIVDDRGDAAVIRAAAGENWNDFVLWSIAKGYAGLENLVLIPGAVGAAPIQNIGAYGVEIREFVHAVDAWDRTTGTLVRFDNAECAFAYRDSRFKREPDRYIVVALDVLLPRRREPRLGYAGVRDELTAMGVDDATPAMIAEAVSRLRRRKLPDPALIGNAGSFFKNPVVAIELADALTREHPTMPRWPTGDAVKLSAAWLIEQAGLKGVRDGDAGISDRHALVLVNHGRATGAQLWAFAQHVQQRVLERYGVALEPEPRVV